MKLKSVEAWRHYPIDVFLPGNLISTGHWRERETQPNFGLNLHVIAQHT